LIPFVLLLVDDCGGRWYSDGQLWIIMGDSMCKGSWHMLKLQN